MISIEAKFRIKSLVKINLNKPNKEAQKYLTLIRQRMKIIVCNPSSEEKKDNYTIEQEKISNLSCRRRMRTITKRRVRKTRPMKEIGC